MKQKIGLVGMPIAHSLSPFIHQLLHDVPYELFETIDLPSVFFDPQVLGVNITAPLKEEAFKLASNLSEAASVTKSVNTLIRHQDQFYGYNTDAIALMNMFKILTFPKDILIGVIGNGATHRSVLYAFNQCGFTNIKVFARNPKSGEFPFDQWDQDIKIIIQSTPMGMRGVPAVYPFPLTFVQHVQWVCDVVYAPLNTPLILAAKKYGIPFQSGLSMLVRQAIEGSKLFSKELKEIDLNSLYQRVLHEQANIVIVGMPYAGKTTFAKFLAQRLHRSFIDTDQKIEQLVGCSTKEYINKKGIEAFRIVEKEIIQSLRFTVKSVIATGGGAILDEENMLVLKANGIIGWLKNPPPNFFNTSRPLALDIDAYQALLKTRLPLYQSWSDFQFERGKQPDHTFQAWRNAYETYLYHQRP
jgi:shikimate dehydrogenase